MKPDDKMQGVVKWYHEGKGRGFLTADTGIDIRVYKSGIPGTGVKILKEYQRVSFVIAKVEGELVATDVTVIPG